MKHSYILFLEHKAKNPDQIERPAGYTQCDFRDELVCKICGFEEYDDPSPLPAPVILGVGQGLHLLCLQRNTSLVFLK